MRGLVLLAFAACSSGAPAPIAPARVAADAGVAVVIAPDAAGPPCVKGPSLTALVGDTMRLCSEAGCWLFAADGTWTNVERVVAYPTATVDPGAAQVEVCTAVDACTKVRPQTNGMVTAAAVDRAGMVLAILLDTGRKTEAEIWDLATGSRVAMISGAELSAVDFVEGTLLTAVFDLDDDAITGHLQVWNGKKVHRIGVQLEDLRAWTSIGAGLGVFQLGEALVPIELATGKRQPAIDWRALLGDEALDHLELAGADGRLAVVAHFQDGTTRAGVLSLVGAAPASFAIPYCDA